MKYLVVCPCTVFLDLFLTIETSRALLVVILVVDCVVFFLYRIFAHCTDELSFTKTSKTNKIALHFIVRPSEILSLFQRRLAVGANEVFYMVVSVLSENHMFVGYRLVTSVA